MNHPPDLAPVFRPVTVADKRLAARCVRGRVVVIDDDTEILEALVALIELDGYACETYDSGLAYLRVLNYNRPCFPGPCCVLCDIKMPELDGLELQRRLASLDNTPLILMSGSSGAQETALAFRAGALNFLTKPFDAQILLDAIAEAMAVSTERQLQDRNQAELARRIATLTPREYEIARRVAAGQTNPAIAAELGIALRTVKLHRQRAMEKVGAGGTAELVRIAGHALDVERRSGLNADMDGHLPESLPNAEPDTVPSVAWTLAESADRVCELARSVELKLNETQIDDELHALLAELKTELAALKNQLQPFFDLPPRHTTIDPGVANDGA